MIERQYPTVLSTTIETLAAQLSDFTTRPVLLDARSKEEFAVSHLRGAQHVNPKADSVLGLDTLSAETPVVVYCSVGYRSARIAHRLQKQGFTNVVNLKGSIFQWANEGRSVVRDGTLIGAVHPYGRAWGMLLDDSLHCRAPAECPL
jgi:rhodanese-related sulfurtransferase